MKILKKTIWVALFIFYEFALINFAADNFTFARNWFRVVNSIPVFQSNIEFVIYLGQFPVVLVVALYLGTRRLDTGQ